MIQRNLLGELLDREEYNSIFGAGALRLITGHAPYRRRVYVKLAFQFTGEGDHQHCVCVLLADLHQYIFLYVQQYIFLYECFKSAHSKSFREQKNVDLLQAAASNIDDSTFSHGMNNAALRAWMGYSKSDIHALLGVPQRRDGMIQYGRILVYE